MTNLKFNKIPGVFTIVAIMWCIQLAQMVSMTNFANFGILPRTLQGFIQIPLAPLIHGNIYHLISNSVPLLFIGFLIHLKGRTLFWKLTISISLLSGLGVWLIGSSAYHIGASGLVLGLWSFIIADAFYRQSISAAVLALIALAVYGGFAFTVLDLRPNISWAGHMSGLVAGIFIARTR